MVTVINIRTQRYQHLWHESLHVFDDHLDFLRVGCPHLLDQQTLFQCLTAWDLLRLSSKCSFSKKITFILFPSQKAPWPFWAVQVWSWIGLCTMQNSTSWNQESFSWYWEYSGTFATMKARMVQMLGLLWMKLVVPSGYFGPFFNSSWQPIGSMLQLEPCLTFWMCKNLLGRWSKLSIMKWTFGCVGQWSKLFFLCEYENLLGR